MNGSQDCTTPQAVGVFGQVQCGHVSPHSLQGYELPEDDGKGIDVDLFIADLAD